MTPTIRVKDSDIEFPHFIILKASAGSGKTHTLTRNLVQFLLSDRIRRNGLRNILAITFSNNAAKEMKERSLAWLKEIYFGEPGKMREMSETLSLDPDEMRKRAGSLIEAILDSYSDFQVKTIDSFMTMVFKASAVDFGYNPDFEIMLNNGPLMEYSYNLFMRNVRDGSTEASFLEEIVDSLLQQQRSAESYLWDPSATLLNEIKKIYRKISAFGKPLHFVDYGIEMREVKEKIVSCIEAIETEIERSELKRSGNSSYRTIITSVRNGNFADLVGRGFAHLPVTKVKGKNGDRKAYETIASLWREAGDLVRQFTVLFARSRCLPYATVLQALDAAMERAKRQQGRIFIEDINLRLAEYLSGDIVPDVYFRMGETIFHFLIDEFQDTSPIQWRNLFPLIENSLSQGGSLFAVGDTKQAIYGFRNADYAIMKGLEKCNPFPSASHVVKELNINYRSRKKILEFNEKIFKEMLPQNPEYGEAGNRSGLTQYCQEPADQEGEGYVEISLLERNDEDPTERERLQNIIGDLHDRGYRYGEIAVLAQTNEDAVNATTWLNEKGIDFISFSSLDVRRRKITGEIIALLNFLDSPTDDFAFGTFIHGDIFSRALRKEGKDAGYEFGKFCFSRRGRRPLYKAFQEAFEELWQWYFRDLFRAAGFLPLYDLVCEVFAVFRVFEAVPEEEGAIVKILEVVKDFEGKGFNSLKDFLGAAVDNEKGDSEWDMPAPKNLDAVSVMTIHKAKGLGFPVVIVLLYEVRNRGFEYIVEEREEGLHLLKINKDIAACDELLQQLYERERMSETVNRLNSLYVAFTRPKRELYIIGVGDTKAYPFVLFPSGQFCPSDKPECKAEKPAQPLVASGHLSLFHCGQRLDFGEGAEDFMSIEERRRGEFIHKILSLVDYVKDGFGMELASIIDLVKRETDWENAGEEIETLITAMMKDPVISEFFLEKPGRKIMREQEYSDSLGRLFRMDRVIVDESTVTVIDYKTGKDRSAIEKFMAQMRNYEKILGEIYPDHDIRAFIVLVDLAEVKRLT